MTKEQFIYKNHIEKQVIDAQEATATTILNMTIKEYDYETTRARSFDTRSGIFIGFIGTILVFLMSQITVFQIELTATLPFGEAILIVLSGVSLFLAVTGFLTAIHFFIKTISVAKYKRLPIDISKEFYQKKNTYIMQNYVNLLSNACHIYRESNELKALHFNYGCRLSYGSVIATVISYVFTLVKLLFFGV
ncbi:hypothetical protein [Selenomonas massiliensis]|uniref:hypothetical protein n=1 Tax=Selenomonas massiliensis TaxID=2058293 RepID=UPI000D0EF8F0|nr:hypothetical protein [Selenomonas massiliensis]